MNNENIWRNVTLLLIGSVFGVFGALFISYLAFGSDTSALSKENKYEIAVNKRLIQENMERATKLQTHFDFLSKKQTEILTELKVIASTTIRIERDTNTLDERLRTQWKEYHKQKKLNR